MAITFTITDKGKAAIKNGLDSKKAPQITAVGFGSNGYSPSKSQTSLQKQIKKLTTVGGQAAGANMLHVTVQDESTDTYSVKEMGIYLADGTLFAVYSQKDVIIEKSAEALVMLAIDIAVEDIDATKLTFGNAAFVDPPATTSTRGVVMLNDSVTSTAKDQAATANAVKKANDNANSRETPKGSQDKVNSHAKARTAHNADQISVKPPSPFSGLNSVQAMLGALGSAARLNAGTGTNDVVQGGRKINAGNGFDSSTGGNLTKDLTLKMGAPSQISGTSTNRAWGDTHTHAIDKASTKNPGIVQLNDSTSSTATNQAATPNAVKHVNDNANSRETPSGAQAKVDHHAKAKTAHDAGQISAKPPSALKGKNDVQSVIEALGSAATHDVGTSSGQIMPVGAFGIGGSTPILGSDDSIQDIKQSGLYAVRKNTPKDWPKGVGAYAQLIVNYQSDSNAAYMIIDFHNDLYVATVTGGKMTDWEQVVMNDDLASVAISGNAADLSGKINLNVIPHLNGDPNDGWVRLTNNANGDNQTRGSIGIYRDGSRFYYTVDGKERVSWDKSGTMLAGNVPTAHIPDLAISSAGNGAIALWAQSAGKNATYGLRIYGNGGGGAFSNMNGFYSGNKYFGWDDKGALDAGTVPAARVTGLAKIATSGTWGDLAGKPAQATRWPSWNEITKKPTNLVTNGMAGIAGSASSLGNNDYLVNIKQSGFYAVRNAMPKDGPQKAYHYGQFIVNFSTDSNASFSYIDARGNIWVSATSSGKMRDWTQVYTDGMTVPISNGGTGATSAIAARKSLGLSALAASGKWGDVNDKPAQATRWPTWSEVTSKPNFSKLATSGAWGDIAKKPAQATRWPSWDEVTGKPYLGGASGKGTAGLNKSPWDYTLWKGDYDNVTLAGDVYSCFMSLPKAARSGSYNDLSDKPNLGSSASTNVLDGNYSYDQLPWGKGQVPSTGTLRQVIGHIPGALNGWLAQMGYADIGCYGFFRQQNNQYIGKGQVVAGGSLLWSSAGEHHDTETPPGSWMCVGNTNNKKGSDGDEVTLFRRVS